MSGELLKTGYTHITDFQKKVIEECLLKTGGGISLPMGSGKTLITLVLSIIYNQRFDKPVLIIVSKTLLSNWKTEIEKFFGKELKYTIIHTEKKNTTTFQIKNTPIFITTPETLSKFYKLCMIEENYFIRREIVNEGIFGQHEIVHYNRPEKPFIEPSINERGGTQFYSIKWAAVIIDELQQYTNIGTQRARAIASLSAENRWGLSGTMFNEPKVERILGYHIIINHPVFPRNLPGAVRWLKSQQFPGVKHTLVARSQNEDFSSKPELVQKIVNHTLKPQEELLYIGIQDIMQQINELYKTFRENGDVENARRYGSYRLACITYLRQMLICPVLPLSSAMIDTLSLDKKKSKLCEIMVKNIDELNLMDWLNDEQNIVSSRIQSTIDTIDLHPDERVIVFSNYSSCLKLVSHILSARTDRKIYTISCDMTALKRAAVIKSFEANETAIFLLSYQIGSEGLNLQCACTMILLDLWWNAGTTSQAIARIMRNGQKAQKVNIYFLSSNTGIEKFILNKQQKKLEMLDELQEGNMTMTKETFGFKELLNIIELEENNIRLSRINERFN